MNPSAVMARWIAEAPPAWSAAALDGARRAFVDTVACMLAGAGDPAARNATSAVVGWGDGGCVVVGTGRRLAAPWAALVNGTAAHALDYDDVIEVGAAHVSAALVPAVLALGEETGASGRACLDAYLTGFEIMARLAEAVNMAHYFRGWHTTLTLGTPAAAAACARLLGLDRERAGAAISLATSMASGFKRQFGTMAKPLHAGLAAKNGLLAARLAAAGLTAAPDAYEGSRGFVELFAGAGADRLAAAVGRLGDPPAIERHGVWFKFYPCCASLHRPLDAVLALRDEHRLAPASVTAVRAVVSEIAVQNLPYTDPRDEMQARFSMPYALAAALIDGRPTLAAFAPAALARAEIRALLPRIVMHADPAQPGTASADSIRDSATVAVRLVDGRELSRRIVDPRGHPRRPLTDAELAEKFLECAARAVPLRRAQEALDALGRLAALPGVRELTLQLSNPGA